MSEKETCRAVKRDGQRCTNKPQIAGFCRVHYPKPAPDRQSKFREGMKTAGQIIAVAGGAAKLIETIVQLWQGLSFGPGPSMPRDYTYLEKRLGSSWPELPDAITPFTKGPSSVDWGQARFIYDRSLAVLQQESEDNLDSDQTIAVSRELEAAITTLIDNMQAPFRTMLLEKLGSVGEPEGV